MASESKGSESSPPDLPVQFNVVGKVRPHTGDEHPISWFVAITTYFGYAVLVLFGHVRDFFGKFTGSSRYFGPDMRPMKVRQSAAAAVPVPVCRARINRLGAARAMPLLRRATHRCSRTGKTSTPGAPRNLRPSPCACPPLQLL